MVVLIIATEGDMYVRGKKFEEVMYARKYFTLKLITSEIFFVEYFPNYLILVKVWHSNPYR